MEDFRTRIRGAVHTQFGVLFLLCLVSLGLGSCKKNSGSARSDQVVTGDTLLIGEVGSMTGSEATFGISTHRGILLAVDEINARGGVKGKKLKVQALDNQGKPEEAATAVRKLITQDGVVAILGEVASSRSLAMAPIAQEFQIPMISPSSTNPRVTEQGDYIFRVCFIDPFQGTVMAKFARETLKVSKVAILRDVKNDYSVGLSNFFSEKFKQLGGEVLIDQSYSAGDMDFKSQLTSIRSKNPEAVFVPGYYTEVGLIARQAKELGLNVPLMGGDGWDSPKLTEIGGAAMNGNYFSNHYSAEDKDPAVVDFVARYRKRHRETPDSLAAMGYDAALVLADAMERASVLSPRAIREALAATKNFKAVTGVISMDEKRNAVKSAAVLKVEAGALKFQTTVHP